MTLYLLNNYNNYFDRIIKENKSITFLDFIEDNSSEDIEYSVLSDINFVPGNSVETELILNIKTKWLPSYIIVCDSNDYINSQWFVINSVRERNGQYRLALKRDVISDYYDDVINAPCFIEKATLDYDNPLIFNSEGMTYNQIKKGETLLKDKSNSAWIVGYIARNTSVNEVRTTINNTYYEYNLTSFPFFDYLTTTSNGYTADIEVAPDYFEMLFSYRYITGGVNYQNIEMKFSIDSDVENIVYLGQSRGGTPFVSDGTKKPDYLADLTLTKFNQVADQLHSSLNLTKESDVLNTNLKLVYDTNTAKYYKVTVSKKQSGNKTKYLSPQENINSYSIMKNFYNSIDGSTFTVTDMAGITLNYKNYKIYTIKLTEVPGDEIVCPISLNRNHLNDAPYDMFCIPYHTIAVRASNPYKSFYTNASTTISIAQKITEALSEDLTNANLYDIQLLPYCPIQDILVDGGINVVGRKEGVDYDNIYIKTAGTEEIRYQSIIIWSTSSTGSFTLPYKVFIDEPKIQSECDMYRLCSPNFQGIFEFNAAKNGGIEYFNIDFAYKPYSPYIHINPNFGKLYGTSYKDARGLICGGDFSLTQISNKWAEYEINNKNYQNIFDREIRNMEVGQNINRINRVVDAVTTAGIGAVGGKFAGVGKATGGVIGGLSGIADFALSEATYKESLSYKTDMYNYSLGNIKALPNSLTKLSSLNPNNKMFPVVEYYSCTDEEKDALRNKIKYSGMTVMAIGNIKDYMTDTEKRFVQGQIIRLESLGGPSVIKYSIYDEIKKGVFI